MDKQKNIQVIQDIYAAFRRGDVPAIVAHLTDDVRWVSHYDPIMPWGGDFSGKRRIPRFFEAIFQLVEVLAFEPNEWITEGDTVVSLGEFECKVRSTGRKSRTRLAFIWKFRSDKIASFEQFHDSEFR